MGYKNKKERKALGLCANCPNDALLGKSLCFVCEEKKRKRDTLYREEHKKLGLCAHCSNEAILGMRICVPCAEKHRKRDVAFRLNNLRLGLCCSCSQTALAGRARCGSCAETVRKKSLLSMRNLYKLRGATNRCTACGAPLEEGEGYRTCFNCRHQTAENMTMKGRKYYATNSYRNTNGV